MRYTPEIIVQENFVFTIPLYQRLFEWTTDNVRQLLDDLKCSFEKCDTGDYFIGMLTSTAIEKNETGTQLYLVDGQQRFTVMILMACVLQKYSSDSWKSFLMLNEKPRLFFVSRQSDNNYLLKLIQKEFEYDGEQVNYNMKEGIETIEEYMDNPLAELITKDNV